MAMIVGLNYKLQRSVIRAALVALVFLAFSGCDKGKSKSKYKACVANMKHIDSAKHAAAMELKIQRGQPIPIERITEYQKGKNTAALSGKWPLFSWSSW